MSNVFEIFILSSIAGIKNKATFTRELWIISGTSVRGYCLVLPHSHMLEIVWVSLEEYKQQHYKVGRLDDIAKLIT